ncbi:hypothetical protein WN55_08844 [Dufourea novaeangliae]|uniref:Uncharacterized protein n=1 Tax=Dufourea novaeangliae TaxID=178035 RepID=A0A154P045_DUFNO|nr:hypothetical protein WN55_08844 [Dufourea novaeangliae]
MFETNLEEQPRIHKFWSLPVPTFTISNLFKDNGDMALMKTKITTMECTLKDILEIVKQIIEATKPKPCPTKVDVVSHIDQAEKGPETVIVDPLEPTVIDVTDDEKVDTVQNTEKYEMMPINVDDGVINGDSFSAVETSTNEKETAPVETVNKETLKPSENIDTYLLPDVNENQSNKNDHENNEGSELIAKPQEIEALQIPDESKSRTKEGKDDRALLTEDERRWNTPPELIPEQVIRQPYTKNGRSLSIPITANINLNTGNNAHSLGFQVGPEGLSYSESNSFNHPAISQSQSVSLAAGATGIAGSAAQSVGQYHPVHGNQGNVNSNSFGFGNTAASSSGAVQNGHVATAASSSVGSLHSSASSSAGSIGHSGGTHIRFPNGNQGQPTWTNIRPNHNSNDRQPSNQPKLEIDVKPHRGHREQNRESIILHVTPHRPQWENRRPIIRVHKWHPSYRAYYDDEQF